MLFNLIIDLQYNVIFKLFSKQGIHKVEVKDENAYVITVLFNRTIVLRSIKVILIISVLNQIKFSLWTYITWTNGFLKVHEKRFTNKINIVNFIVNFIVKSIVNHKKK